MKEHAETVLEDSWGSQSTNWQKCNLILFYLRKNQALIKQNVPWEQALDWITHMFVFAALK